jgi:hypothetical protein
MFREADDSAVCSDPGEKADKPVKHVYVPVFRVEHCPASVILAAAKAAGLAITPITGIQGYRWYRLGITMRGKSNRRAVMAESAFQIMQQFATSEPDFYVCRVGA